MPKLSPMTSVVNTTRCLTTLTNDAVLCRPFADLVDARLLPAITQPNIIGLMINCLAHTFPLPPPPALRLRQADAVYLATSSTE